LPKKRAHIKREKTKEELRPFLTILGTSQRARFLFKQTKQTGRDLPNHRKREKRITLDRESAINRGPGSKCQTRQVFSLPQHFAKPLSLVTSFSKISPTLRAYQTSS
jgi:hypothetical protein